MGADWAVLSPSSKIRPLQLSVPSPRHQTWWAPPRNVSEIPHVGETGLLPAVSVGGGGENQGREREQNADFLPSAMLAWVGPRTCFVPGTVSALTAADGLDFGAHLADWELGC